MIVDQCVDNCSFPSGHGSLGFWVTALAFLAPPRWRKAALTAALAFGVVVGVVRIAQGGHFLSDVVFSAILVIAINIWFKRLLLPENPSL